MLAGVVVVTACFNLPINRQFNDRNEGDIPPNAAELRTRWRKFHWVRTAPALGMLVCLVFAVTYV